ncbi:MAG: ATP-binding protein [Candidatus Omnitrophica bacterium]|nr:ATP-binding protein [Candidatus Omnitrophota bacterium]
MIRRLLTQQLSARLKRFPAVSILGPRQSGKTTLAKTFSARYFDLEQSEDQLKLDLTWDSLVRSKQLIVLDEAQVLPSIFPRIRGAIDAERKRNGRFLLLGSVAPPLMKKVSESLAGRLAICELCPLFLAELNEKFHEDEMWLRGGFPDGGILKKKDFPVWEKDYLTLLAQRDLPAWGLPAKPQTTIKFFRMLAACHGQIWNASKIGASLGLSYHTVNHYLDYLENIYLILSLPPYHVNIRKRLVKSPKLYWRDSGLLHALLEISGKEALLSQPWAGASWEGWCINQILATLKTTGRNFDAHFFRTNDGHEIDLILKLSQGLWAFEFKLTSSPGLEDMKRLSSVADLIKADKCFLISKTRNPEIGKKIVSANIRHCLKMMLGSWKM